MKFLEIQPPSNTLERENVSIFLAGSIEMGKAEKWQDEVKKNFMFKNEPLIWYNPRREDWDSTWKQEYACTYFRGQVQWELRHILAADIVFIYFSPGTVSPISLLELGLCMSRPKHGLVVCCPPGFERKGNVDVTCKYYGHPVYKDLEVAIMALYEAFVVIKERI